ncbi:type II toxin-antitoxin system RelE family toxin [Piscibacillus halophilus]|uniref:type II toxin-antitoxin system RelE family toxin n=1 Tax=Piscibacillus halophilus TaxID=571933 RepID=UPI003CCCC5EF
MKPMDVIEKGLENSNVKVLFTESSVNDLISLDKGQQKIVIKQIIKRGKNGPLIKPKGLGDPLRGELSGFTKIKLDKQKLRVIYKPKEKKVIEMGVLVIGPRNNNKVYDIAIKRLKDFDKEIANK